MIYESLLKPQKSVTFKCVSQQCPTIIKIPEKFQISFRKIVKNKWYHALLSVLLNVLLPAGFIIGCWFYYLSVLLKMFILNGHTIGFRRQTSLQVTLRVNELRFMWKKPFLAFNFK